MTTLNKRLNQLCQTLGSIPKKAVKIGEWRLNPNEMVTWMFKDDKKEIFVMFQGQNMGYKLKTQEEYLEAKKQLENYNF